MQRLHRKLLKDSQNQALRSLLGLSEGSPNQCYLAEDPFVFQGGAKDRTNQSQSRLQVLKIEIQILSASSHQLSFVAAPKTLQFTGCLIKWSH